MTDTRTPQPDSLSKNALLGHLANAGAINAAKDILEAGADPNFSIYSANAARPLQTAFKKGDVAMVKLLMEYGAEPKSNFSLNEVQMYVAECHKKESTHYRQVLDAVFDSKPEPIEIGNAIIACSKIGDTEYLKELFERKVDVQKWQMDEAIGSAVSNNQPETVKILASHGAEITVSHLTRAGFFKEPETMENCLRLGNFTQQDKDQALVQVFSATRDYDRIEPLIRAGADLHAQNDRIWDISQNNKDSQFIETLIVKHGYKLPEKENSGFFDFSQRDDDFAKAINQTLGKRELFDKLNKPVLTSHPTQGIVRKAKSQGMKI